MRHKKVKNLDSRMVAVRNYLIEDIGGSALALAESAKKYRGHRRAYFAGLQGSEEWPDASRF